MTWSLKKNLNVKHVTSPLLKRTFGSFTCLSIQESPSTVKNVIMFTNHRLSFSGMLRNIMMKNPIGVHIVKSPSYLRVIWQVKRFNMIRRNNTSARIVISHSLNMTQFEIERRSCGQSMKMFRLISCGGHNNFTGGNSFFVMFLVRNLQKEWKKCPKSIHLWPCIRYCTDRLTLWTCATFQPIFGD